MTNKAASEHYKEHHLVNDDFLITFYSPTIGKEIEIWAFWKNDKDIYTAVMKEHHESRNSARQIWNNLVNEDGWKHLQQHPGWVNYTTESLYQHLEDFLAYMDLLSQYQSDD
jgi:hypothetical protein